MSNNSNNNKKQTIVIKKVIVQGGGHHGGSWKVALADFMTALMCFFLVMWLIGQSEETKKSISDYFSTPSMIEYNYENFGAEITLEKLFLDFVNEPMKAIQSFFEPADKTPNILDMNSEKVINAYMADKLTDTAKNVTVSKDTLEFDIPDHLLFEKGTAKPKVEFIGIMDRLTSLTAGLKDAEISLTSAMFVQVVPEGTQASAEKVAQARLELVKNKIAATFEHPSNDIKASINVKDKKGEFEMDKLVGFIRIKINQKESKATTPKVKATAKAVETENPDASYEGFAQEILNEHVENQARPKRSTSGMGVPLEGIDPNLRNPVDLELNRLEQDSNPSH